MFLLFSFLQDIAQEAVKKRRRAAKKPYSRSIVGATLEVIQKKRAEKPEVRDAAREAALRYVIALSLNFSIDDAEYLPNLEDVSMFITRLNYTLINHIYLV